MYLIISVDISFTKMKNESSKHRENTPAFKWYRKICTLESTYERKQVTTTNKGEHMLYNEHLIVTEICTKTTDIFIGSSIPKQRCSRNCCT